MRTYDKFYIDGAWVAAAGDETLDVIDSTTEAVFATIPAGVAADIDRAVAAAKARVPVVVRDTGTGARQAPPARLRGARGTARRHRRRDHPRGRHAQAAVGDDPGRHRNLRVQERVGTGLDLRVRGHGARPRRARADRCRRVHHAVELPAQPDRRRRSHTRSRRVAPSCSSRRRWRRSTRSSSPRSSTTSGSRPACSTSSPASARWSARRSPPTPTST